MIERSLKFGPKESLVATLCLPEAGEKKSEPAAGILLFNAGIVHRIGPHRVNVRLARELAKAGIPSIRFDLGGLGDSTRSGGEAGFEAQAIEDIRAAMNALSEATGLQRFGLFGFCSGAYHGFGAAQIDERIAGLLLFDAYRYPTLRSRVNSLLLRYRQYGPAKAIARLIRKPLEKIGEWIRNARHAKEGNPAGIGFVVDSTPRKRFAEDVRRLLDRGVDIRMVLAGDGLEVYNYPRQFHDAFKGTGIGDRVDVAFLPDIDHVVTSITAQARLIDHVMDWSANLARVPFSPARSVKWEKDGRRREKPPAAIVLSRTITGLGTIRSLGRAGIEVHAFYFNPADPVRFSRYCRPVLVDERSHSHDALLEKLISYAKELGNRPVVYPGSDAHALMLAGARERLEPYCRIVTDTYDHMTRLISKDGLYAYANAASVKLIPYLIAPTPAQVSEWTDGHPGPYLVKPFYTGVSSARMTAKNQVFETSEALLQYVAEGSMDSLIVQRMIRGGDGYIFDCYGYSSQGGRLVSMVSRRRIRQFLPDYGTCTFGELPAAPEIESVIFAGTRRLLDEIGYRGIFDIEWLRDRETGELYLIDFNARPAMGITHLTAGGLNLPALAYDDLTGKDLSMVEQTPRLPHLRAMDIWRDIDSFIAKRKRGEITLREWLASVATCRHFYYMTWRDPMPGLARQIEAMRRSVRYFMRRVFGWRRADPTPIRKGL